MIKKIVYIFCFFVATLTACKKPFEPAAITVDNNFLVVDGVINATANGSTIITLSRTKRLADTTINSVETTAQVTVEGESGGVFSLVNLGDGRYTSNQLNINSAGKYRLKIITADGKQYLSAFVAVKPTPAIDSVTWKQPDDLTISVHTRDRQNNTRYYRWDFVETWQYTAPLNTAWGEKNGRIFVVDSNTQLFTCWISVNSTAILLGNSIQLSEDVISSLPLTTIPKNSEKPLIKYSILVNQYALTREAYEYWQILQKNTQNLGTLFDPQPSQLKGNIQCVTNPGEPVIGFVSICPIEQKRIFINYAELANWPGPPPADNCGIIGIPQDPVDFLNYTFDDPTYAPYYFVSAGPLILAKKICLDCTQKGGATRRPAFWQ
jgi:Domain of unknown function (DUF4249)